MRKPPALLIAVALAAGAAGCGSAASSSSRTGAHSTTSAPAAPSGSAAAPSGSAAAPSGSAAAPKGAVRDVIKNLQFNPQEIHAKVGEKITWTNEDGPPHNITYQSGPRFKDSPRILYPGHSYTITLTHPGTISYFCSIHPFMHGTIVVAK